MPTIVVSVTNDWLAYLQAFSTALAALVTAGTIVFIAIQTALTRRSVRATEESVKATERALELGLREFDRNTELIKDSQRVRIDAEMPRLTTFLTEQPRQVWAIGPDGDQEEDNLLRQDNNSLHRESFHVSLADYGDQRIQVGFHVSISNDGPRGARIAVDQPSNPVFEKTELFVGAGTQETQWVRCVLSMREWVDAALRFERDAGERPQASVRDVLRLTYVFPGDTGATEIHLVTLKGSVLAPTGDGGDSWTIAPYGPDGFEGLRATAEPFTREYFSSYKKGRRL